MQFDISWRRGIADRVSVKSLKEKEQCKAFLTSSFLAPVVISVFSQRFFHPVYRDEK